MKKVIACVVIILGIAVQSFSQTTIADFQKMSPAQKATYFTDSMKTILSLTNDQYEKVHSIALETITKSLEVRQSEESKIGKGRQLKDLLTSEEDKLKSVLSNEQFEKYQKNKQNLIAYYKKQFREEKIILIQQ